MSKTAMRELIEKKGWQVTTLGYERPKSGFKCIEGGWFCELKTDEDDWDILESIPFDNKVFGTISGSGLIMALYKKDFVELIKKLPPKPSPNKQ